MIVVQQYLEAAREGDKRVIMIDGEPKVPSESATGPTITEVIFTWGARLSKRS